MTDPSAPREWHLVQRPHGRALTLDDLSLVESPLPNVGPGQVRVRNTHLSVDPYMRGRMDDRPSYMAPFALNTPLDGAAIGVVEESRTDDVKPGQIVQHFLGLREVVVLDAAAVVAIDPAGLAPEVYLGTLGATGLTAWLGITQIADVRPGDTVLVTGAAGAVGSVAGQIARLRGADTVIGTAGTESKRSRLMSDLGFDAAVDHRADDVSTLIGKAAPNGIDVVFDNVGGALLEAAIDHLNIGARLALCGAAAQYDGRESFGVRNLYDLVTKRATARGFLVTDHLDQMPAFHAEVSPWVGAGSITHQETMYEGIEQVPNALLDLLRTGSPIVGKAVVTVEGTS